MIVFQSINHDWDGDHSASNTYSDVELDADRAALDNGT